MGRQSLTSDLFIVPAKGRKILYAPAKRLAFLCNDAAISLLSKLQEHQDISNPSKEEKEVIELLANVGIIDGTPEKIARTDSSAPFKPTELTLFLTNRCNLRCIYCYASGGEKSSLTLAPHIVEAAIDFIAANAIETGVKDIHVGFHGGGEPTVEWELLVNSVSYAQRISRKAKLGIAVSMATNGLLKESQLDWIVRNLTSVNLSLDGPADIQNRHRPDPQGEGSFDRVFASAQRLDEESFSYGIRSTITKWSVDHMAAIVDFFCKNLKCRNIHFEPLFECGRCVRNKLHAPSPHKFISSFRKALKTASQYGARLLYSGARLYALTDKFCLAAGESFCITPDGYVTSCFEVCSPDDPLADIFFYGHFDQRVGRFVFNDQKLFRLRRRTVNNIPFCRSCFCKYHCAGDCLARVERQRRENSSTYSERCIINQKLTRDQILEVLYESERS